MKLTICAITYNEEEHLAKWYNLHKELADEIFIVDTGSYDNTLRVAKDLGLKVYSIEWKHSFAEAKNKAISIATGDWILFQNPDLWIQPYNFKFIKQVIKSKKIKGFALPCINEKKFHKMDLPYKKKVKEIWKETHLCLFKKEPSIEYRQRVHENVHESILEAYGEKAIKILPIIRYHHMPEKVYKNKDKLRYYQFLEDYGAMERKFWEHGEYLRKKCYDNELSK